MKMNYYSVRDIKSATFNRPFVGLSIEQVKRSLYMSLLTQESEIAKFPEDFELYLIGEFDDQAGALVGQTPAMLCNIREIVAEYERRKPKNE